MVDVVAVALHGKVDVIVVVAREIVGDGNGEALGTPTMTVSVTGPIPDA